MTLLDRRVGTVLGSELDLLGKLPPPNSSINFNAVSRPDETRPARKEASEVQRPEAWEV